ncbi:MAG: malectin domain-containing carbohydrate-binding protein [Rubrobacteraceae bacterium]
MVYSSSGRMALLVSPVLFLATIAFFLSAGPSWSAATYQVNAGGPEVSGASAWSQDTGASPSPYVNAAETGNKVAAAGSAIDMSHPSVPEDTPEDLFETERWDPGTAPEMKWAFPVEPGNYKVSLYFAETYSGAQAVGARVFDVSAEGALVLDDYDVFAKAGGGYKGIVETFTVASDDTLNIDFLHAKIQHPAIKAIKVVPASPDSTPANSTVSFGKSLLQGETSFRPTSLQFGPDGRLYVAQQNGAIKAYTVARDSADSYSVTKTEAIDDIKNIPNYNDDGSPMPQDNPDFGKRQVTGILVTGTAENPVIYAGSSDPRIGGGAGTNNKGDVNLDTNSGMISRLDRDGAGWTRTDLVRGLPRSEENHSPNGIQLSPDDKTLYVAIGGNTNNGAPSANFAELPEYALSAAILEIDLEAIGDTTYDLPTLDDETRAGNPDANDPFGGNDGKNQARIVPGGPVQVYASGFRNAYDVLMAKSGKMYAIDNGGNAGWGDVPVNEGPDGSCTNQKNEPGTTDKDTLQLVSGAGYYGGHPNPTRGSTANTFNADRQSPVPAANPVECDYRAPGAEKGSLASFDASTNGSSEYTASSFGGAMKGDLLAAGYDNTIYRLKLNDAGTGVVKKQPLFSTVGGTTLDVAAQDDADLFPGTVWVADIWANNIVAFEPKEEDTCDAAYDPNLDSDQDGFSNSDEIDNETDPCSSADLPPDYDGDNTSNLNDPDDDNDGQPDTSDPFAVDKDNGKTTGLPVRYTWDNDAPSPGGLSNLGFTGLMTNKTSNYESLYDPTNMTAGGAAGAVTIDEIPGGDAYQKTNTQKYGFQFGVNATPASGVFTARTRIAAPFAGIEPQGNQSMGLFIGNGDQDNYVRLAAHANGGKGSIDLTGEMNGSANKSVRYPVGLPGPEAVDLFLTVDPAAGAVQASYSVTTDGVTGPRTKLGSPKAVPAGWLDGTNALAVGIISTSNGGPAFSATWDSIEVIPGGALDLPGKWQSRASSSENRQEVSYVKAGGKFYLAGGGALHERYDPATDSWEKVAPLPADLDHIQGVEVDGKIYYVGGLSGWPDPSVNTVYIYDPETDSFSRGAPMPAGRDRGAGGVAAYEGKIYYAGGLREGSAVSWFDRYDPETDSWTQLPDMPRARDHFQSAIVDGKLYAIGGRDTNVDATTTKADVYNLAGGTEVAWKTLDTALPTARGGFATAVLGKEILVIGGEGGGNAYDLVEAYDTAANSWRALAPMPTARHGVQAVACNGGVYIAGGGKAQQGGSPTNVHEAFFLDGATRCAPTDATPPDTGITSGPSGVTKDATASFRFSASEAGARFQCKRDEGTFESCDSPKEYADVSDGEHTFQVRAVDGAGNVDPTPASRDWSVDTRAPAGSVTINGGGTYTRDATVDLTLESTDPSPGSGTDSMRFSNADSSWSEWEPYAAAKSWKLGDGDGGKTVQVQYRDKAGNVSERARDEIELDTTTPDTTITDGPSGFARSTAATFTWGSNDKEPTNLSYSYKLDDKAWTAFSAKTGVEFTDLPQGEHTLRVKARDAAGGVDPTPATRSWTVDSVAPKGPVKINGGKAYTRSFSVKLSLSAADPSPASGLREMRFRNDGGSWSGWEPYAATKDWTLRKANGTRTVYVEYSDKAGNASSVEDKIRLDMKRPYIRDISPRHRSTTRDRTPTIRATVRDDMTNLSKNNIKLYVAGSRISSTKYTYRRNTDRLIYRSARLSKGRKNVKIVATDAAGNVERKAWYFKIR